MQCTSEANEKINFLKVCECHILTQDLGNCTHPSNTWITAKLNLHRELPREDMTANLVRDAGKIRIPSLCCLIR